MRIFRVVVNGNEYEVGIEELQQEKGVVRPIETQAKPVKTVEPSKATIKPEPAKSAAGSTAAETIVAPMPGTILRVEVNIGDSVAQGDTLLILEAMKMENEILAPMNGVVKQLNVEKGASVNPGDILVILAH